MTAPRQIVPGRTYLVTRRCTQRQSLLRPDRQVEQIYLYCLAEAAARYDITLHAWIAMSNHHHVVLRDDKGKLPEFLAHLHKMTAKALNAKWGRCENLWSSEQPNAVHTVEPSDAFDKLVYVLANSVAEDLVERVSDWPGACSLTENLSGRSRTIERPRGYFRDAGPMPAAVTLRAERIAGFEHLSQFEWAEKIRERVRAVESGARAARVEHGRYVLGRKSVLRAHHTSRPRSREPRRRLRPTLACKDAPRRVHELELLRGFREAYGAALRRWLGGDFRVLFPVGTYRMARLGARCQSGESGIATTVNAR